MKAKFLTKPLALTFVAAVFGAGDASAVLFGDFQIDESPYGGGTVTADKVNGAYVERVTFDGIGGFDVVAYANYGQYLANEGSLNVPTVLNDAGANQGYGLYATLIATGVVSDLGGGLTQFTGTSGDYDLYVDPLQDTTFGLPASAPGSVILGNNGDDLRIGFSTTAGLGPATGILQAGVGGFFDFLWGDFTLTNPDGTGFFIDPAPFFETMNLDGDFEDFQPVGNQIVTGDISMVFPIPEPTSLALMSLGLLGFGYSRRRQAS